MILSKALPDENIDQGHIITGLANPCFATLQVSVVLNPTCLFSNHKVDSIVLAYLIPAKYVLERNRQWRTFLDSLPERCRIGGEDISRKKQGSVENVLGMLIDNDEPRRHFYLGALEEVGLGDVFVDFQQVSSFPLATMAAKVKIIAKVRSPFREKLATHYAGYMMRIGVDRYHGADRARILSALAAPVRMPPSDAG